MTQRDRIALTVVIVAALLAGFWFLLMAPQRDKASKLGTQLTQQRQRLATARSDEAASRAAHAQYARNYASVAQLGKAVPADDQVPSLVYQLSSTAASAGVQFQSIKLQSAGSGAAAPPTASPASPTQAATASLPPGAVVGPAGFPTMPFSFTFEGSFFRLSDFFARVEGLIQSRKRGLSVRGRLLTIDGLALTAGPQGFPTMKASVAATAYLLPAEQGLTNGATPTAPPASGAQPVSTTSTAAPKTPPAATVKVGP